MTDLVRTKLGYRICDWNGNTIIENLPHLHQSTWTINGMQQGAPGSVAVGNFTIPLYPPRSQEYLQNKGIYDKIPYGARVEAYVLGESGEYAFGMQPVFSGIITKINRILDSFQIQGFDSLWMAQQTIMYPGMSFQSTGGGLALQLFNDIDNLMIADDFAGSRFPQNITWTTILGSGFSQVTDDGLPTWSNSVVNVESELATTITSNPFQSFSGTPDVIVATGWFHVSNISTTNTVESDVSLILASDSTAQNLFLCRCLITGNGTTYDMAAQLWHKSGGTYTMDASQSVFTGLTGDRRIQLVAIVTLTVTNAWQIRLLVNGKDSNCIASYVPSSPFNSNNRYWGWRWFQSAGSAATGTFTRFYMKVRMADLASDLNLSQPLVQPFNESVGPNGVNPLNLTSINTLTLIDLWSIGATLENYIWRKDCARQKIEPLGAAAGDLITWGTQGVDAGAGSDLSASIILDEATNIVSGGQTANAESLGTEVRLGFDPSPDSDGTIFWPDIQGMMTLGQASFGSAPLVLMDSVSVTGLHDILVARRMAQTSGARKALTASSSKQFTIIRDPTIATPQFISYNTVHGIRTYKGLSVNAFRELDFVTLNCPSIGIFNQKVSVQSYTFHEDNPLIDITLDQFAFNEKLLVDRRRFGNLDSVFLSVALRA